MSRSKRRDLRDPKRLEQEERTLRVHIRQLGLTGVSEYKDWCRQHGFSSATHKDYRQRERERLVVVRQAAEARLVQAQRERRNPQDVIARIFEGDVRADHVTQRHLQAMCRGYEATKWDRLAKLALKRLLLHVQRLRGFFDHRPALSHLGWQPGNTYVDALSALAYHSRSWLRPVEDWKPRTHNTGRQFAALARHLLAEYPVPSFFDSVWFKAASPEARRQQRWFIHVARGKNIRTADLPIPYTKRMAHHFMQAPNEYTIEAALRWGQVHALGGDARLTEAIRATRLGESFRHDDFWVTVLGFFIANPMLDPVFVGPIIDYLHDRRFVSREVFVAPGVIERRPPEQPNLSMKGRTPESLLRQVRQWHRRLAHETHANVEWPGSGIGGFEFVEGVEGSPSLKRWTIRELLSTKALVAEGRAMRHCVASYAGSCARRATSIWALEVESHLGRFKALTVEVRLSSKLICQARGKLNARADEKMRSILRRWAGQEGLKLASYV